MSIMSVKQLHPGLVSLSLACFFTAPAYSLSSDHSKDEVRKSLQLLWDSLDTMSFHHKEWRTTSAGAPLTDLGVSHVDFKLAAGGRRAALCWYEYTDRREVISDFRQDGRVRTIQYHTKDQPDLVDSVILETQLETHSNASAGMTTALNLLAPFGQPLHLYFDGQSSVETVTDDTGSSAPQLSLVIRGYRYTIMLDPVHDFLPRIHRVYTEDSTDLLSEVRVDRYDRDNGRWFPASGRRTYTHQDERQYVTFEVDDIKINREIDDSVFNPPKSFEAGVVVEDRIKERTQISGSPQPRAARATREAFQKRHGLQTAESSSGTLSRPTSSRPARASSDPERFPWLVLLSVSALLAATPLLLKLTRTIRGHS